MQIPARTPARAAVAAMCLVLAASMAGCGRSGGSQADRTQSNQPSRPRSGAAAAFLADYVRPDGRVTRPDQGGDTVSEGQAYGLLLAEVAGDHAAFARVWQWTQRHLQLPDGLFAFHASATGKVLSRQPASDADVLIAWALLRYRGPGTAPRHKEGRRVAAAVLAHEVTGGPGGMPVLAAGPWATGRPASLDPSYWSLGAFTGLAALTRNRQWQRLARAAMTLLEQLTAGGRRLPPDWAELTAAGVVRAEPAPSGAEPQIQYGLDAQRTVVWLAASCDPQARRLAARWWPLIRPGKRAQALALRPDGTVLNGAPAVLPLVAAAAAARSAGDKPAWRSLLRRAARLQHRDPTYYGGAWAALGPALLTARDLGSC